MLQYKHEFAEQKVTLVDEEEMRKQVDSDVRKTLAANGGQPDNASNLADSKREAEKLIMSKASSYTTAK